MLQNEWTKFTNTNSTKLTRNISFAVPIGVLIQKGHVYKQSDDAYYKCHGKSQQEWLRYPLVTTLHCVSYISLRNEPIGGRNAAQITRILQHGENILLVTSGHFNVSSLEYVSCPKHQVLNKRGVRFLCHGTFNLSAVKLRAESVSDIGPLRFLRVLCQAGPSKTCCLPFRLLCLGMVFVTLCWYNILHSLGKMKACYAQQSRIAIFWPRRYNMFF